MTNIRAVLTVICMLAVMALLAANVTEAQTAPSAPPKIPVPQTSPSPELLKQYTGPAMSLADVPLTPEEASGAVPALTVKNARGGVAHIYPTPAAAAARKAAALKRGAVPAAATPMTYHGGPVMIYPQIYTIFWIPSQLQNGGSTSFSPQYALLQILNAAYLPGHGLLNIATQYYQTVGGTSSYIQNFGYWAGYAVDTNPYPASGCTDTATPGNCLSDAQIRAEIQNIMTANNWTGGDNKLFLLFTSSGEGSCFNASSCAYVQYCAYHSYFTSGGLHVIYGNEPYADANVCKLASQTTPNGDLGDLSANVASHEILESVTDPLLNAWYDTSLSGEIGDKCAWIFGANTWNGPSAAGNQNWNGTVLELQQEWDNNALGCTSAGPQ